jgi:hypothetical protein
MASSITIYHRLEPRARNGDPDVGLEARIADPLWMLGRQWQLGESRGEDAASPVSVRVRLRTSRLSRWQPGPLVPAIGPPQLARDYDPSELPLEMLVEEEASAQPLTLRAAAGAGLRFADDLRAVGLAHLVSVYLERYPLQLPPEALAVDPAAPATLAVFGGRAPDGGRIAVDLARTLPNTLPTDPALTVADMATLLPIAIRWFAWFTAEVAPPVESGTWLPERMEYRFSVAAPIDGGELALTANDYGGGGLDWYDLDPAPGATLGTSGGEVSDIVRAVLPTPVTFPGMPAERWWQYEDASVDLGSMDAAPDDLARLLLVEFATVFGNDWFIVPVDLPFASVTRVGSVVVTNTFGEQILIAPTDHAVQNGGLWRMFDPAAPGGFGRPGVGVDALVLPPVLATHLEGAPLEEVLLLRDEMANMAWAVERVVEGPSGASLSRTEQWHRRIAEAAANQPAPSPPLAPLKYTVESTVPDHWIPLLPVQLDSTRRAVRLVRGAMLRYGDGDPVPVAPIGRLLEPEQPLALFEEEVPRAGSRVTRVPVLARWLDGSTVHWIGRRKRTGRGEGSSGLRFDSADPT